MQWESLGFKENPFNTDPITQITLELYTGRNKEIQIFKNVLHEKNILAVIEGARGVGTTSFANYLRFSAQKDKHYFTPRNEIRVGAAWTLETLLAVIISNIVREVELFQPEKISKDKRFKNAKSLSLRIAEAYRSFGITAFGFGVNYGKSAGITSHPMVVPSSVLGHHLEDLAELINSVNYKYGTLVQLNNLDIPELHNEKHMKYLFNAMRDYFQTDGISWLLVGDVGLRQFIAQQVDRLDDIISYEEEMPPLTHKEYKNLIDKRLDYYKLNTKAILPIDQEVLDYLYEITRGRLRYIFGLLQRLTNNLFVGDLTDRITLDIAKPVITEMATKRIAKHKLTQNEEQILKTLVKLQSATASELANKTRKSSQHVSNILSSLAKTKLITVRNEGRARVYLPILDAVVAYGATM